MNILNRCIFLNTSSVEPPAEKPARKKQGPISDYQEVFEKKAGKKVLGSYALTKILAYSDRKQAILLQQLNKNTYSNMERCMGTTPLIAPCRSRLGHYFKRPGESQAEFFARVQYEKKYWEKFDQLPFMEQAFIVPLRTPAWSNGLLEPLVKQSDYTGPEAIRSINRRMAAPARKNVEQANRQGPQANRP